MTAPQRAAWLTPAIVGSAVLVQTLSSTVILNGLPVMGAAFGVGPLRMNVAITSYLLAVAVCLPFSGWMADRYGARRVFLAAIVLFSAASAVGGFAQTLEYMLVARVLQGAAGSALLPVARLILLRTVPKSELVGALAVLAMPSLLGPVIGPVLGGAIITFTDWRWIFFMNLPFSVLAFGLVWRYVPEVTERVRRPVDAVGALLTGVGLAALILAFEEAASERPVPWVIAGLAVGGVTAIMLYLWHARRTLHPVIDPSIFRLQSYSASVLGGSLQRITISANPFLLVMLLQVGLGHSAFAAGMMIAVSGAASILMKSAAPPILRRFGFRTVLLANSVVVAFSVAAPALFTDRWSAPAVMAVLAIGGFFRSLQFTALNALGYAEVEPERMGVATTTSSMVQQLTQSLAICLAATLLHASMRWHGTDVVTAEATALVFVAVAVIGWLSVLWFIRLPSTVGDEMNNR